MDCRGLLKETQADIPNMEQNKEKQEQFKTGFKMAVKLVFKPGYCCLDCKIIKYRTLSKSDAIDS